MDLSPTNIVLKTLKYSLIIFFVLSPALLPVILSMMFPDKQDYIFTELTIHYGFVWLFLVLAFIFVKVFSGKKTSVTTENIQSNQVIILQPGHMAVGNQVEDKVTYTNIAISKKNKLVKILNYSTTILVMGFIVMALLFLNVESFGVVILVWPFLIICFFLMLIITRCSVSISKLNSVLIKTDLDENDVFYIHNPGSGLSAMISTIFIPILFVMFILSIPYILAIFG